MKLGLAKLAEEQTEVVKPEEQDKNTLVTCMSDCQYAQNPERVCMLESISLNMSKEGQFECGQYTPTQQAEPQMQAGAQPNASAEMNQNAGQAQSQRQLGLAGAKTT